MADPSDTCRSATTIGSYSLAIARALESYGVDSAGVFRAAGIPTWLTNDPMQRLSVASMQDLFRACVAATKDPYFGLTVARFGRISTLHALGYGLAASHTLLDFCRRCDRYFGMISSAVAISLREDKREVALRFEHITDLCAETEDAVLAFLVLTMRRLGDANFSPLRVEFHHSKPSEGSGPYESLFRAPVGFDRTSSLLVFAKPDLLSPLSGACPELARVHDIIATRYIGQLDKRDVINPA